MTRHVHSFETAHEVSKSYFVMSLFFRQCSLPCSNNPKTDVSISWNIDQQLHWHSSADVILNFHIRSSCIARLNANCHLFNRTSTFWDDNFTCECVAVRRTFGNERVLTGILWWWTWDMSQTPSNAIFQLELRVETFVRSFYRRINLRLSYARISNVSHLRTALPFKTPSWQTTRKTFHFIYFIC